MKQIGCFVTTHEAVIFKLLKSKNHPRFKQVQELIMDLIPSTGLV
jgi:hypothetical protein